MRHKKGPLPEVRRAGGKPNFGGSSDHYKVNRTATFGILKRLSGRWLLRALPSRRQVADAFRQIASNLQRFRPGRHRPRPARPKPHKPFAYKPAV